MSGLDFATVDGFNPGEVPLSFQAAATVRPRLSIVRRRLAWEMVLGAILVALMLPANSLAFKSAPKIVRAGASTSNTEPESAEVILVVRTGELETTYEVWLENEGAASKAAEGKIPASKLEQEVTIKLSHLLPNHTYGLEVFASNADGSVGAGSSFTTFPPLPPGCPYGCPVHEPPPEQPREPPPPSRWGIEGAERAAAEAPRREAELEAKKRHEEEEEASAKERALHEEGERAGREASERDARAHRIQCVVPHLEGDSLTKAKRALHAAHCALGRVRRPGRPHELVVTGQGSHPGSRLPSGTAIALRLGRPASHSHR